MAKNNGKNPKRTLTITVGPETERLLELFRLHIADSNIGMSISTNSVASACLHQGMCKYLKHLGIEQPPAWPSTLE